MLSSLVLSLIMTWLLELAFAFLLGIRRSKDLFLILLVNLITNPAVVYLALTFRYSLPSRFLIPLLESLAVAVEALYYRSYALTIRHPWLFSLAANGFSYGIGWLLQHG